MNDYSRIPKHMRSGLDLYVQRGIAPGGFLAAVLENNLMESVGRADDKNIACLPAWAQTIYNEVPSNCHGSPQAVEEWVNAGGLEGMAKGAP